ncbi:MAG TPA: LytTR family DNA-binding domain-containing protein [Gemmatimonadales bacterium]|nr:LytTR family DNA-binding domain-containing protein [Gemmatimonadales bacterium]
MSRWLKWFGFWTLLGAVASAQFYLAHERPPALPATWGQALAASVPAWWLWAFLSPAVAWLARRFRMDRASFGRHFFIHLGASLDLALVQLVAAVAVQDALHTLRGEPFPFAQQLVDAFTTSYHWNVLLYWAILAVVHAGDYHRDLEERRAAVVELEAQLQALAGAPARAVQARRGGEWAERLLVADDGRSYFVRTADVEWIEAARNYVRLHVGGRAHVLRSTLAALERRLDAGRFRRISRSAVVNLDRVREVQPWFHGDAVVILESGTRVTLSRRYRQSLLGAGTL